jgi:hypothetical protein
MDFLRMLLAKEQEETRVEVHHTKNSEYKAQLQAREKLLQGLRERFEVHISV